MPAPAWDTTREHRRPLFVHPLLRLPGQSMDERITHHQEKLADLVVPTFCLVVLAVFEWWRWWFPVPPMPLPFTAIALIAVLYAFPRVMRHRAGMKTDRQGRDGERYVGQMLEQLRDKGYRVFHDIPGEGFNIDHVIIGPAGVFTIETKTRSKPPSGRPTIVYDGNTIRIEKGFRFDEPLKQARAQAWWLANLLNDGRGTRFSVRPIVVFPDWYVERTGPRSKDDVWVLNPKALGTFLDYEPPVLSADRIDDAAHDLIRRCPRI